MHLEDELKRALRRQDPSPGFAARVAAVAAEEVREPWWRAWPQHFQVTPRWRMAWAAGLAAMLTVGLVVHSEYQERKAERAGREAVLALRIAAEKLNFARSKVLEFQQPDAEQER